jgi:hypothetical protein
MEQHKATFWSKTNWEGVAAKKKSEDLPKSIFLMLSG